MPTIYKTIYCFIAIISTLSLSLQAAPEEGSNAEKNKKLGWAFTPDPSLPNVLILGDSISIGYTLQVREMLKGKANVYRPVNKDSTRPVNCSGTTDGLKRCQAILKAHKWDVIHFNWGLHDLKHVKKAGTHLNSSNPKDPYQASPEVYGENLKKIVVELKKTNAKLIFATTTPVVEGTTNPLREADAPAKYNAVATKIMKENSIPVNDLYALCLPNLATWQLPRNVHFKKAGSVAMAKKVVSAITEKLEKK